MNYYLTSIHNQNYQQNKRFPEKLTITFPQYDQEFSYFAKQKEFITILSLTYNPFYKYLLHEKNLYNINFWNVFDHIQDIKSNHIIPFDLKNFKYIKNIDWTYTPYNILGTNNKDLKLLANITEDGFIYSVDVFNNNVLTYRYFIDCRGFVSSCWKVKNNNSESGTFYNENGDKMLTISADGSVNIFNTKLTSTLNSSYTNIYSLALDVFTKKIKVNKNDSLITVLNNENINLANYNCNTSNIFYTYFGEDLSDAELADYISKAEKTIKIIIDSNTKQIQLKKLKEKRKLNFKTEKCFLFDNRIKINESQFVGYNKLLIYIDKNFKDIFKLIDYLFKNLKKLPKISFTFISKDDFDKNIKNEILKLAKEQINNLNEHKIDFKIINNDIYFLKELIDTRIYINASMNIDTYLQQNIIAAGIPQINLTDNGNIKEGINGLTIDDVTKISKALDYYLNNLNNWNRSFIYCQKKEL